MARMFDQKSPHEDGWMDRCFDVGMDIISSHRKGLLRDKIENGIIHILGKDQIEFNVRQEAAQQPTVSPEAERYVG
ncbi:MAG TPA: hypothetical protein VGE30_01385 [Candidatus Saccharimonadales bacterium]